MRLKDKHAQSAGNVDVVLVAYDSAGKVTDFGALEVQAVYIAGNIRNPFAYYMESPRARMGMDLSARPNYPRSDYLSSSRKRLAPQLLFKGGIFKAWGKESAVALNKAFFDTLPPLEPVAPEQADIAWLVYALVHDRDQNIYNLEQDKVVYTKFRESLDKITRPEPGEVADFIQELQEKVAEALENANPPDMETIDGIFLRPRLPVRLAGDFSGRPRR